VRAAFDIGGTFTDFVLQGPGGVHTRTLKVPTSQADPAKAVLAGFQRLLEDGHIAAAAAPCHRPCELAKRLVTAFPAAFLPTARISSGRSANAKAPRAWISPSKCAIA